MRRWIQIDFIGHPASGLGYDFAKYPRIFVNILLKLKSEVSTRLPARAAVKKILGLKPDRRTNIKSAAISKSLTAKALPLKTWKCSFLIAVLPCNEEMTTFPRIQGFDENILLKAVTKGSQMMPDVGRPVVIPELPGLQA